MLYALLVVGALLVLLAIRVLRKGPFVLSRALVVSVDENGNETSREWVQITPPDRYASDGLSHLETYIKRLVAFEGFLSSILIFALDGHRGFSIYKTDGVVTIGLSFDTTSDGVKERKAREFFAAKGCAVQKEYTAGSGSISDAIRILDWVVPNDELSLTSLATEVGMELCGVSSSEGLEFRYSEKVESPL